MIIFVRYLPHAVCKRRKTASSDGGSRVHHYDHSGSESVGGSRPGTPLCDERPENFQPSEPRRVERREREGPLTLPLPRFAAQVMNRGKSDIFLSYNFFYKHVWLQILSQFLLSFNCVIAFMLYL